MKETGGYATSGWQEVIPPIKMRLWVSPYLQYIGRDQSDEVRGGLCFSVVSVASGSRWVGKQGANHVIREAWACHRDGCWEDIFKMAVLEDEWAALHWKQTLTTSLWFAVAGTTSDLLSS